MKKLDLRKTLHFIRISLFTIITFTIIGTISSVSTKEPSSSDLNLSTKKSQPNNSSNTSTQKKATLTKKREHKLSNSKKKTNKSKKAKSISIYDESLFKNSCIEITYNDLDKNWIGKNITKEILFTSTDTDSYTCGATEDFIEEWDEFQHTYRIYTIFDKRFDKSFPIHSNDVIKIYGVISDIEMNYANGLNYPIINMYYADYIREWGKPVDTTISMEELISKRNAENRKKEAENEYYNSLNSDYTGQTKNIKNMENLSCDEFKEKCDSMNFQNMVDSTEDLTGHYVKIHIQLTNHKKFQSDKGKQSRLGKLANLYDINDNVWYGKLFCERADDYIGDFITIYFVNNSTYNLDKLEKNQELTIYGMVLNYEVNNNFHNSFDFLTVYIE